jgi:hypothetical protein
MEDDLHIFATLYYRHIFKCIQFLLAYLPFQAHLDFELVHPTEFEDHRIYCQMNMGDWWWDTEDQLRAGATIVLVTCASDRTHVIKLSDNQPTWPLYLTIGNVQKDICHTPIKHTWIFVGLIPCPRKGAKNIDNALHSAVGTVLSQLRQLDITGPGLKWDCADGFQQQCYPLLAAWVRDHLEQVMIAQVPYGSCPLCEIPNGAPTGHSTI